MTSSFSSNSDPLPRRIAVGERVRITSGQLAGLAGAVANVSQSGHYTLSMDQVAEGVYVVVSETALERCERRYLLTIDETSGSRYRRALWRGYNDALLLPRFVDQ